MNLKMTSSSALAVVLILVSGAPAAETAALTNSIGMKLAPVAAGSFTVGQDGPPADYRMTKHPEKYDDADWDERPAHKVTIGIGFSIGATEVTLGQYRQFKPEYQKGRGAEDDAVTGVSWEEAVKFCAWLSAKEGRTYRLPTEAEWEYACRAGTATLFNVGDRLPDGFQKWIGDAGARERYFQGKMAPEYRVEKELSLKVAQMPPNAWGLYDMHGNVSEWCADWYGPYEATEQTDPLGRSEGDFRVMRGGAHSMFARQLRSANRGGWLPGVGNEKTGFRVVLGELPKGTLLPPPPAPLNAQHVDQSLAKIQAPPEDGPFFAGPVPYVKIPADSVGPLYSAHNHSPSITECPNGDLLAVWYSCADEAGPELCNLASRLRRGAGEWEPASPFWDGPDINDHAPKVWWDGEKTIFHFARGRDENLLRTSTDNGATWSKARILQPVGEFGNALLKLRDGTLVLGNDSRGTSLVFSKDGGRTWAYNALTPEEGKAAPGGTGARYPGIHAPMVQLADGRIMAASRNDRPDVQEKFGGKTALSFTSDLGKTWNFEAMEFPAISSVQRQVMMRLREGPLLFCSFTDQMVKGTVRKGMTFKAADGSEFTGFGLFAAVSYDDGKTWPVRRLVTPGGAQRMVNGIDRSQFALSETTAEPLGYMAACQTRDGRVQLISSKNHYGFNLAWLEELPGRP